MGYKTFKEYVKEKQQENAGGSSSGNSGYMTFEQYVSMKRQIEATPELRKKCYDDSGIELMRKDFKSFQSEADAAVNKSKGMDSMYAVGSGAWKNSLDDPKTEEERLAVTGDIMQKIERWKTHLDNEWKYFETNADYFTQEQLDSVAEELNGYYEELWKYGNQLIGKHIERAERTGQAKLQTRPTSAIVGQSESGDALVNPQISAPEKAAWESFYAGNAPVAELRASTEEEGAAIQGINEEIEKWNKKIAWAEAQIAEHEAMGHTEDADEVRQLLQTYQAEKAPLESEREERNARKFVDEKTEEYYWRAAFFSKQQDTDADKKIEAGKKKYETDYAKWENAVKGSSEVTGMKKENLTFYNEEEYQKWLENEFAFLGTDSQVQGKKVNRDGSVEVTVATADYSMDVPGAQKRAREGLPIALSIDHLDDKEKEIFYYLVGAGYEDMAASYVQQMAIEERSEKLKEIEDWAGKNFGTGILATLGYGALLPAAGYDFLTAENKYAETGLNANPKLGPGAVRDSLAGGVSKSLNDWSGTISDKVPVIGGKGLGDVYQMGLSMGDSYGSAMAFGKYATVFLGLSAASSAYNDAIDRGASVEQAQAVGALSGISEVFFEYASIEKFLSGKSTGKWIVDALVQGGVEGSEEFLTSAANRITDNKVMGLLSNRDIAIEKYMKDGKSYEEAKELATREFANELAYDFFGGVITGGTMEGLRGGGNAIKRRLVESGFVSNVMRTPESKASAYVKEKAGVTENDAAKEAERKLRKWYQKDSLKEFAEYLWLKEEALAEKDGKDSEPGEENTANQLPDWEQYEKDNAHKRFVREVRDDLYDETERFEIDRNDLYYDALEFSDSEMQQETEHWEAIRNNESVDGKGREQAQYMLDALDAAQQERIKAAEQEMQQQEKINGGFENGSNAEILNDSGKRDEGMGTGGQAGTVAEGAGRSVSRSERAKQKAVLADLKENGRARSAKEIGVVNGSEEQSLYVLEQSDIDQSAQWKRIQEDAEAQGARAVLFAGDLKVHNPSRKTYSTMEGIHKVDDNGEVTYYIKVDGNRRDAERVYLHEKFHNMVHNNPELLGDLILSLQLEYERHEIVRLVTAYVEAYKGIYGTFEKGMSKKAEDKLVMRYMDEIFADVYADIQRGKIETASARKIMRDQTDAVQRAAQNLKGIKNKKAPPKQSYSAEYEKTLPDQRIMQLIEEVKNGKYNDADYVDLGIVSDSVAKRIKEIVGVDVTGWKIKLEARQVRHILKDHGENGTSNKSMADDEDIAKLFLAISSPDSIVYGGRTRAYSSYIDGFNRTAETVLCEKNIGEKSYYVVQAVPVSKKKTLYVVSAFIGQSGYKKGTQQLIDAKSPNATPKDGSAEVPIKKIPQSKDNVKQSYSIETVEGEKGTYKNCVILDTNIFDGKPPRMWGEILSSFAYQNLAGKTLTMFDEQGKPETVEVAKENDRVKKDGAKNSHKVLDKLARYTGDNTKALATVHLSELLLASHSETRNQDHSHQWMDENGWIHRHVFLMDKNGKIYDATLNIADGRDRRIVYAINMVEEIDKVKGTAHGAVPSTENGRGSHIKSSSSEGRITQTTGKVKQEFSVAEDEAELDAEYERKMAEDEEPGRGKSEPDWDKVRSSMDAYNAAAKSEKEKRAEKNSISTLKNRIEYNERKLRELTDMKNMAKKSNFLSRNMDREIENRKAVIRETLEIDRAVLKTKQEAKKQEEKTRKQKKQEKDLREMKARQATEELVDQVLELFSTKKGERWDIREMLHEVADQIVKEGRITDKTRDKLLEVLYENSEVIAEPDGYYSDIRKYMQQTKIYVPDSVRSEFGDDWESVRKSARGNRIYLTADPKDMGIDSVTQELQDMFGGTFTEDADLKEQLERILDLAEEGKSEKITLPEMMRRNRDTYGWSVEEQMDDLERKLDEALKTFSEKASIEISIRQKSLRDMIKQREGFQKVLERQREAKATSALMDQVLKRAQRLKKYRKRATPSVQRMIDEQIGDLDTLARSISSKGLEDIQLIMDNYTKTAEELGEAFVANPEIQQRFDRVKQTHLADMTVDEVRELGEALTGLITQIQNYNRMVSEERRIFVTDMANQAQQEIKASDGRKNTGVLQKYMQGQLNAKVFFGKISGFADGAWKLLAEKLSQGEEMARQYQMRAMAMFDPFLSDKANQQWLKKAAGENALWETVNVKGAQVLGDEGVVKTLDSIELTPMMKVSLLMHSKNIDNLQHIGYFEKNGDVYELKGGGVTIPDKALYKKGKMQEAYAQGTVLRIPPDVVRAIAKSCTQQEKTFAALLTKYFDGMSKSAVNEVSLAVDGWERATVQNYFPIQSDKAFVVTENELIKQDLSLQGSSFLKERSHKGTNPMYLFDATDVLFRNIEQVSKYYGLTRPLRDLQAVMNATYYQSSDKQTESTAENELLRRVKEQEGWGKVTYGSVEKTLLDKWGTDAKDYIEKLSKDLQGDKTKGNIMGDLLSKLRGNYARAVISFNPSSVLKQLSSYPVALAYLNVDDLAAGLKSKYFKNAKEAVMNLSRYSAVYWYRNQGNVNTELKEYMERKGTLASLPLGYKWTQMMDSAVTRRLLAACMHHVSKNMGLQPGSQESIDAGTDRYWAEVAKLFNKVVLDTQSNTSVMERADIARGDRNSIEKFITMFRTDAFQQHNLQVEARGMLKAAKKAYDANPTDANKKRLKEAKKHLLKTTAGVLTGQIMVGAITSLLSIVTFRDKDYYDEEGKFDWGKFFADIGLNIVEGYAGLILGLDWIWSLAEAKIMDEKWYGPEVVGLESLKTFGEDVSNFFKAVTELDFREGKKQFRKLAKSAGMVFGLPVSNIEKYLMAACRWIAPEFAEKWEGWWDDTAKDDLKNRSPRIVDDAISVILDNRTDDLSDEDKAEIARLYMEGGTGAVPSGIPTSFSYTTEDGEEVKVTMSPKQREKYREAWNEIVSGELHKLLSSEAYESADDETKTEYIDKLYKFAEQVAKNAVDPGKALDKWVQQGLDAKDNGVSIAEYAAFRVDLSDITGTDESGETVTGLKRQRCMELLEAMGWTDEQEKDIWLDVIDDNESSEIDKEKKIQKLMAEGMSREDAEIAAGMTKEEEVDALSAAGLSWDQINDIVVIPAGKKRERLAAIAGMKTGEKEKVAAMSVYGSFKEKNLFKTGYDYGVKMEWYMEVLENADGYNDDGKKNGSVDQEEARAYISIMDISYQEKTYLFQMVTDCKEGKKNPFWSSAARLFWLDAHENDPPEEDEK